MWLPEIIQNSKHITKFVEFFSGERIDTSDSAWKSFKNGLNTRTQLIFLNIFHHGWLSFVIILLMAFLSAGKDTSINIIYSLLTHTFSPTLCTCLFSGLFLRLPSLPWALEWIPLPSILFCHQFDKKKDKRFGHISCFWQSLEYLPFKFLMMLGV